MMGEISHLLCLFHCLWKKSSFDSFIPSSTRYPIFRLFEIWRSVLEEKKGMKRGICTKSHPILMCSIDARYARRHWFDDEVPNPDTLTLWTLWAAFIQKERECKKLWFTYEVSIYLLLVCVKWHILLRVQALKLIFISDKARVVWEVFHLYCNFHTLLFDFDFEQFEKSWWTVCEARGLMNRD
jgi:hypothetical protein